MQHKAFLVVMLSMLACTAANGLSKFGLPKGSKKGSNVVSSTSNTSNRMLKGNNTTVKGPSARECKTKEKGAKIEFECKTKDDDTDNDTEIKDKIKFKVSTGKDGLAVKIEYEQEIETNSTQTETETEYEVVFDTLIEYAKSGSDFGEDAANDAYDWDNDIIVQSLALEEWTTFSEVVDDDNGVVSYFEVSTTDGIATFNFTISRADQGDKVTANKMKIDVYIDSFPWSQSDTYVALLSSVESKKEIKVDYDDDDNDENNDDNDDNDGPKGPKKAMEIKITFEEAQDAVGTIPFGEYTWEDTAEVLDVMSNETNSMMDGTSTTIQVIATSPELNETEAISIQDIAFSFVGEAAQMADLIYWDPETGIGYTSDEGTATTTTTTLGDEEGVTIDVGGGEEGSTPSGGGGNDEGNTPSGGDGSDEGNTPTGGGGDGGNTPTGLEEGETTPSGVMMMIGGGSSFWKLSALAVATLLMAMV